MRKLYFIAALGMIQFFAQAQTHTVSGPKTIYNIPAGTANYAFLNLETGKQVAVADSATEKWHMAFNKTKVIFNSGNAGPGTVTGQMLPTDFMSTKSLPATGYKTENTAATIIPTGSGNGWYNYNPATHQITADESRSFAVKFGNRYALVQILDYYQDQDPTKTASVYSIRCQVTEGTDVSQKYTRVSNLFSGYANRQMFDLASADTVLTTDSSSSKWNLSFASTNIYANSGVSGPGTTEAMIASGTFNSITEAPAGGYATGSAAVPSGSGNGWYLYNSDTHTINAYADRTIVVKDGLGHYAKLAVKSYYLGAPAAPAPTDPSRYYTFEYYFNPFIGTDLDVQNATTGINPVSGIANAFSVYPNPSANGTTHISYPAVFAGQTYQVTDIQGKIVSTAVLDNSGDAAIATSQLNPGLYLVHLAGKTQKLIVQ
ncbi:MAG: HmuY family protein [Bacteroidota bacterium]